MSHAGDYVVGVLSDCEVGCDIEKNSKAPLEVAEHYFYSTELEYIRSADDKNRAFFTLWTLKESYMKMTGKGMSLALDSFEVIPTENGFILGKSSEKNCFLRLWNSMDIFFPSVMKWSLLLTKRSSAIFCNGINFI